MYVEIDLFDHITTISIVNPLSVHISNSNYM